jgi:hypothetical protein
MPMQARDLAAFSALLLGCLALSACARSAEQPPGTSPSKENAMTEPPSTSQTGTGAATTDEGPLVDAQVGPHRFRIPAHYFDNQMGPEFDGSFGLFLEWPRLEAFPAGARSGLKLDVSLRQIDISPGEVRTDIHTLLDRKVDRVNLGHLSPNDGSDEKDGVRVQGDTIYGLTPYYTDFSKLIAFNKRKYGENNAANDEQSTFNDDWYLARAAQGQLSTVIRCTSRGIQSDGVFVDGPTVKSDGSNTYIPSCTHSIVLPDHGIGVEIRYLRAFLKDWKAIEDRTRQLIHRFMVSSPNTSNP